MAKKEIVTNKWQEYNKLSKAEIENLISMRKTDKKVKIAKAKKAGSWTFTHAVLVFWLLICLFPFVWSVFVSFKDKYQIPETGLNPFPKAGEWTLDNYKTIFDPNGVYAEYVPTWFVNSFVYTLATASTNAFLAILGGYALAGTRMKGKSPLMRYFLVSILVPVQATIVPTFFIFDRIGAVGSEGNYIMFLLMTTFSGAIGIHNTLLSRQFFMTQSAEMEEAGKMDGYSSFKVFVKVTFRKMLPLAGTVFVMSFIGSWNNFFIFQLIAAGDPYKMTLVSAIYYVAAGAQEPEVGQALSLALSNISFVPIFIVYLLTLKVQIRGIKGGNK